MQVTIDKFGRMVLPKSIRDDFDLVPGTVLEVEENREAIVLKPMRDRSPIKQKEAVLVFAGEPAEDLKEAVVRHREKEGVHFCPRGENR